MSVFTIKGKCHSRSPEKGSFLRIPPKVRIKREVAQVIKPVGEAVSKLCWLFRKGRASVCLPIPRLEEMRTRIRGASAQGGHPVSSPVSLKSYYLNNSRT